jgi:hypothetical protein
MQQRLSEWRSNIDSTALVIIVIFCSHIKDAPNDLIAKQLLKDCTFVYEDLDNILWETAYLSAFVLQMIASTHLSAIVDHASVPALNTDELALGKGMDGVIVLCVIAVSVFFNHVSFLIVSSLNMPSSLLKTASSMLMKFSRLWPLASFLSSSQ